MTTIDERLLTVYQELCAVVRTLNTVSNNSNAVGLVEAMQARDLLNAAATVVYDVRRRCTWNIDAAALSNTVAHQSRFTKRGKRSKSARGRPKSR